MSLRAVMNAELDFQRAQQELHDASFMRVALLLMGAVFMAYGLFAESAPGIISGSVALFLAIYFSSEVIPKHRRAVEVTRLLFNAAIEAL